MKQQFITKKPPNSARVKPSLHTSSSFVMPYTTVDVVIFAVLDDALKVLLVRRPHDDEEPYPGLWALPGGFVNVDVDVDLPACAGRKLYEKTGLVGPYLEQLGSWGSAVRDPRGWSATHVFFALVPGQDLSLSKGGNASDVAWCEVGQALRKTKLAFDHAEILAAAIERLHAKVEYTSLPVFLLAEPFTLPQLQRTYELILGRPVDKSSFRTRVLAAQFLDEVGFLDGESNRPAMGYKLRDRSASVVFPRTFSPRNG